MPPNHLMVSFGLKIVLQNLLLRQYLLTIYTLKFLREFAAWRSVNQEKPLFYEQ
tara:strand:- start:436 stop:597 length:162 start_codon:yes stop_codon:yes gene_type:complete